MSRFLTILLVSAASVVSAQEQVLSFEDYLEIVRNNHPISKNANLQLELGSAGVTSARGSFDPVVFYERSSKQFNDSDYYSLTDQGLKVPTWFGLEFYAGLEKNDGAYLDPENNTPDNGLYYAGVSLALGKGLFIDKRRADLREALIMRDRMEAERRLMFNEILLEAGLAYWEWYSAYRMLTVYQQAFDVAEQRRVAVVQAADLGDRAAIDTLEAAIQVQNRQISLQDASVRFLNAGAYLSTFLWQDGMIPLEIADEVIPGNPELTSENLPEEFDSLILNHPMLQTKEYKIQQLEVERRYKLEQLKPEVNLKYNLLTEPMEGLAPSSFNRNDYAWGLQVKMPILLRRERGQLRMTNLKLEQERNGLVNSQAKIRFKIVEATNEFQNTVIQTGVYESNVANYARLLQGERQMFDAGESSLFLINSREMSYINAQVKLIETIVKNRKAAIKLDYSLGILY